MYPLEIHLSVKTTLKTEVMIKTKQDKNVQKLFPLKSVPTEEKCPHSFSGNSFRTSCIVFFYTLCINILL